MLLACQPREPSTDECLHGRLKIHRPPKRSDRFGDGVFQVMRMTTKETIRRVKKPRVPLTDQDLDHLTEIHNGRDVPTLVKRTSLPYMIVYNVVHGRVKSLSDRHYRKLFGEPPPHRQLKKVDGIQFRRMVRLWLFLNNQSTASDLYREYCGTKHLRKPDLRLFSGKIRTVDIGLESFMFQKFADNGIYGELLDQWLEEMETLSLPGLVPYARIRPLLQYLQNHLGVHPTTILNQTIKRYESGTLKKVSNNVYVRALNLKRSTEKALAAKDVKEIERLRESTKGGKPGYTSYLDIREELRFLSIFAKKSTKKYIGRSSWTYETGAAKRVANWRARKIMRDCDRFISDHPDLPLSILPPTWRRRWVHRLVEAMMHRLFRLLSERDGMVFEKRILKPSHLRADYNNRHHGFTRFDMAPRILKMRRRAFDLMVARHCEIFRSIGTYAKRWYLPELYLEGAF